MHQNAFCVAALVFVAALGLVSADEPKGVTVSLRVKWPGTPVLLEATEFLVRLCSNSDSAGMSVTSRNLLQAVTQPRLHPCRQLKTQKHSGVSSRNGKNPLTLLKTAAGMQSTPMLVSAYQVVLLYPCSNHFPQDSTQLRLKCCITWPSHLRC